MKVEDVKNLIEGLFDEQIELAEKNPKYNILNDEKFTQAVALMTDARIVLDSIDCAIVLKLVSNSKLNLEQLNKQELERWQQLFEPLYKQHVKAILIFGIE